MAVRIPTGNTGRVAEATEAAGKNAGFWEKLTGQVVHGEGASERTLLQKFAPYTDDLAALGKSGAAHKTGSVSQSSDDVVGDARNLSRKQSDVAPSAAGTPSAAPSAPQAEAANPLLSAADTVADVGGTVLGYANGAIMVTDVGLPFLGGAAGMVGLPGVRNVLRAPTDALHGIIENGNMTKKPIAPFGKGTIGGGLMTGTFVGMSLLGTYGVARGFFQKVDSLKQMYADMTGTDARNISTWTLLSSNVPKVIADARSHIMAEHGLRGGVQALGLILNGLNLHKIYKHGTPNFTIDMITGFGAIGADHAIDFAFGESPLVNVYKGFSDAYRSGQAIPPEAYGAFVLAGSTELRERKKVGEEVARIIGEKYAHEKLSPGKILAKFNDKSFNADIHDILIKAEADNAAKIAERKKAAAAKTAQHHAAPSPDPNHAPDSQTRPQTQTSSTGPNPSMVERVATGAKPQRAKVGEGTFTGPMSEDKTPGIVGGIV